MRNCVSFILMIFVVVLMIVDARSPVKCASQCNTAGCPAVDCSCGTYKDECNCCDHCLTCADSTCSPLAGDVCVEGYTCAHPVGTEYMERMNGDGKCVPSHTVNAEGMFAV
ncbi:hypothetical protein JTE90_001602 [Oedothorax gibbosus]|uniref:IGFBP N-terminal domain-containing protein n=1 Tax=Oedothorax gibbosus TaxID=931172 RepID=A0AAV6VLV0_9ARAC|nr:hypothetical protein JTE90_001602 [Oedothorax gibbosus]